MENPIKAIFCGYPQETVDFLNTFKSPDKENSHFKGIPLDLQEKVLKLLPNKNRRIKYRGKSKQYWIRPQAYTIKDYADSFAIYYDNDVQLNLGGL